ncbi:MAG: HAMP domain-containing sensor histidine kinase [Mycobacteriales bacterium]
MSALAAAADAAAGQPVVLLHVSQAVNLTVVVSAVVVLARGGRVRRSPAAGWALAMFSILALIVVLGFFPVSDDGSLLRHGYTVLLVCVLLLVPYLLIRFAYSLGAVGRRTHQVALALTLLQLAFTAGSPPFPKAGAPRSGWFTAFVVVVLVGWTTQSVLSAVGLWSAGRGQPSVVRHRMRTLSTGAVILALALVGSAGSSTPGTALQVVTTLIGVLGICLLVVAFVVPRWLGEIWRADDLQRLGTAERSLMAAVTPTEVATAIVPAVMQLFGASGAALLDKDGRPLGVDGYDDVELSGLHAQLLAEHRDEVLSVTRDGGFACRLSDGWLVVRAGAFAPMFGTAEILLLDRVGSFVDLALQRCQLFEQEARSRQAAEAANAELQTLIYSVSHDLRNPIISVLGYLDVLAEEHAGELQGEGPHYLRRISVNALYMQSLIQDLLELSRIGRSEPAPQAVVLGALAESVAQEVRVMHPSCDISVGGSFPVVWMSELRARQLLTNLIDNAAKHSQGEATVRVEALEEGSGGAVLTVTDNGRGIPPHYREKAFEVFERLDAAHGDVPGTGMGLPICKRIVESVGGSIVLDGPPAHQPTGTTVRVLFPGPVVQSWSAPHPTEQENVS